MLNQILKKLSGRVAKKNKVDPPSSFIDIKNLSKRYGQITALSNVSCQIKEGEFISLVGPSGAGKSTLIRLIIREEMPSGGNLYVANRDIARLSHRELPYYRRKVGVVFQDFKLLHHKTVYENIAFALEVCDVTSTEIRESLPKILRMVSLEHRANNYPLELSGGEKQRVSIARALVHNPKILIADEPTGNLDPTSSMDIVRLLLKINERGTIVILATHNKSIVDDIKKRVVAMKNGEVISDSPHGTYTL